MKQKMSRLWKYYFKEEKAGRDSVALVHLARNSGQVMADAENGKRASIYSEFEYTYRCVPENDPVVRKLESMYDYVHLRPHLKRLSEAYTMPLDDLQIKIWDRKMKEQEYNFLLNATKEEILNVITPDYLRSRAKVA